MTYNKLEVFLTNILNNGLDAESNKYEAYNFIKYFERLSRIPNYKELNLLTRSILNFVNSKFDIMSTNENIYNTLRLLHEEVSNIKTIEGDILALFIAKHIYFITKNAKFMYSEPESMKYGLLYPYTMSVIRRMNIIDNTPVVVTPVVVQNGGDGLVL